MGGHNDNSSSSTSTPKIMVFRPSFEEMKDFSKYIGYMESQGAHKAGLAKIIPPPEWVPRKSGYDNINMIIKHPIQQVVEGGQGMYQLYNIQKKSMTVKEYKKIAESQKYKTPDYFDYEELERKYWKNITYNPPIYGADVPGTITDPDCEEFNISKLNTILDMINTSYGIKIMGVNTAYLYFGMWKSTFAWHTEDMDLYSINYLHFGAPKSWYCIPPEHGRRLERLAAGYFPNSHKECPAFLRHKMTLISPQVLRNNSIPFNKITQESGEFMITFPYAYHAGYNHGFNCAESTNFALERWVEFGKRALRCNCTHESVKISMEAFVKRFQPERYELWLQGKDVGEDPKDGQRSAAPPPSSYELNVFGKTKRHPAHKKEYSSDTEEYDSDELAAFSKCSTSMPTKAEKKQYDITSDVQNPGFSAGHTISETLLRIQSCLDSSPEEKKKMKKKRKKSNDSKDSVPAHLLNHSYAKATTFCTQPATTTNNTSLIRPSNISSTFCRSNQFSGNGILPQTSQFCFNQNQARPSSSLLNNSTLTTKSAVQFLPLESSPLLANLARQTSVNKFTNDNNAECFSMPPQIKPYYLESTSSFNNIKSDLSLPPPKLEEQKAMALSSSKSSKEHCYQTMRKNLFSNLLSSFNDANKVSQSNKTMETIKGLNQMVEASTSTEDFHVYKSHSDAKLLGRLSLWTPNLGMETLRAEIKFNIYSSMIAPHCAICNLLTPFKIFENQLTDEQMERFRPPKESQILIPSSAFTSKVKNEDTKLESKDSSPLLVCIDCRVCVHSVCYGVKDVLFDGDDQQWRCDPCVKKNYYASCCLCPLIGGPLKEVTSNNKNTIEKKSHGNGNTKRSGNEEWAHLVCALLISGVNFIDGVDKKPIDISELQSKKTKNSEKSSCMFCKLQLPDNKITDYLRGYCINCNSGHHKCSSTFHVTCGHREGIVFKPGDWPYPIRVTCQKCTQNIQNKRAPKRSNLPDVDVGQEVLAKNKNNRYYYGKIEEKSIQVFHHVHFVDNSFISDLVNSDFLSHDLVEKPPDIGDNVEVIWRKDQLSGKYAGNHSCTIYTIKFEDGSQVKQKREEFYLPSEEIPKRIKNRLSGSSNSKQLNDEV